MCLFQVTMCCDLQCISTLYIWVSLLIAGMWILRVVLLISLGFLLHATGIANDGEMNPFDEHAQYISPVQPVANGTFASYRTRIQQVPPNCTHATINITTDTKYWLYVNGELVVLGGLKRGPTPTGSYYDTVELMNANWIEGVNTIAVLALYLGRRTVPSSQTWWNNEHHDSGMHALLISGNICGRKLTTNSDWLSRVHPAYTNDIMDDMQQNFRFSDPDIVFDARIAAAESMTTWTMTHYNDSSWPRSLEHGPAGSGRWGELIARPIPFFRRSEHRQYVSLRVETDPHQEDGFNTLGPGDIPGYDLHSSLPTGCCSTATACKEACLSFPACRAAVWTEHSSGCNLKGATPAVLSSLSKRMVFVRAYKRLIGKLPYDAHVTPTLFLTLNSTRGAEIGHDQNESHGLQYYQHGDSANRTVAFPWQHGDYANSGVRIDIRTDSYFTDGSSKDKSHGLGIPNTRAAYIISAPDSEIRVHSSSEPYTRQFLQTNEMREPYESLGWMVGHEVIYSMDVMAPLQPSDLTVGYYESGYDTNLTTPFECDNLFLTKLWQKAQRTLYVNMRDSWMDCPDRERSQWTFDVAMDVHQAFYALSPTAHLLSKKWLLELTAWQKVDHQSPAYEPYAPMSIYAPVPGRIPYRSNTYGTIIPLKDRK